MKRIDAIHKAVAGVDHYRQRVTGLACQLGHDDCYHRIGLVMGCKRLGMARTATIALIRNINVLGGCENRIGCCAWNCSAAKRLYSCMCKARSSSGFCVVCSMADGPKPNNRASSTVGNSPCALL